MYMHCNYVHVYMQLYASDVHVQLFVSDSANLEPTALYIAIQSNNTPVHIRGPTIEMYEGPQGPETKLMNRPGNSGTVEAYGIIMSIQHYYELQVLLY